MIYGTALFLLVVFNQALAQIIPRPNSDCDFRYTVHVGQQLEIFNPGWPGVYKQNSVCRWIVDCHKDQVCRLKCRYIELPESNDCSDDQFLVSTLGSNWLVGSKKYCGLTAIDTVSINSRITIGTTPHVDIETEYKEASKWITIGEVYHIKNPNWPSPYAAGKRCRWILYCPTGYICRMRCDFIALPRTPGCSIDRLLVSKSGDEKFKFAKVYCGQNQTIVNTKSSKSTLSLGLESSVNSPGGRFSCIVRAEPAYKLDLLKHFVKVKTSKRKPYYKAKKT